MKPLALISIFVLVAVGWALFPASVQDPRQIDLAAVDNSGYGVHGEVLKHHIHLPDGILRNPDDFVVVQLTDSGEVEIPAGRSDLWLYRYKSGYVRNILLYLPVNVEPSSTTFYRIYIGRRPKKRHSAYEISRRRGKIAIKKDSLVYEIDFKKLKANPARSKKFWDFLVLRTIVNRRDTSEYVMLNAPVAVEDTLSGEVRYIYTYGEPRVEIDEGGWGAEVRLFFEDDVRRYDIKTRRTEHTDDFSAYVRLLFPAQNSWVEVQTRRTNKKIVPMVNRYIYHFCTFSGLDTANMQVAVRRRLFADRRNVFSIFDPTRADSPLSDSVQIYEKVFSGDTINFGAFDTRGARGYYEYFAVAKKDTLVFFGVAGDGKYQNNYPMGQALVYAGGRVGWAMAYDKPFVDLRVEGEEPWGTWRIYPMLKYDSRVEFYDSLAELYAHRPKLIYQHRNLDLETPAEERVEFPKIPTFEAIANPVEITVEVPDTYLVPAVVEFAIKFMPGVVSDSDFVVLRDGKEILADCVEPVERHPDGSIKKAHIAVLDTLPFGRKARYKVEFGRKSSLSVEPLAVVDSFDTVDFVVRGGDTTDFRRYWVDNGKHLFRIGHFVHRYIGEKDTVFFYTGAFVGTELDGDWFRVIPLLRPYGSVLDIEDAFSELDSAHIIFSFGAPTKRTIRCNRVFCELEFEYTDGYMQVSTEKLNVVPQDLLTGKLLVRIPRDADWVQTWTHRYLKYGIYNHNGFGVGAAIYKTHNAREKQDNTLDAWTFQIDTLNNRRVLVGTPGHPVVDNTGRQKALQKWGENDFRLYQGVNWRGNSPFYLMGKWRSFEDYLVVSGNRQNPSDGIFMWFPGWNRYASTLTYRDNFGYDCTYNDLYIGDVGFVGGASLVQTGWGMGWLPAWVDPGNYDDERITVFGAKFDPSLAHRYDKFAHALKIGLNLK